MVWKSVNFLFTTNLLFSSVNCYNLDTDHAIIFKNPVLFSGVTNNNYFGYSLIMVNEGKSKNKWIKIGAPKKVYCNHNENNDDKKMPIINLCNNNNSSEIIYHCNLIEKCTKDQFFNLNSDNNYSNLSWSGNAMDINYKSKTLAISASYQWQVPKLKNPSFPGGFFLQNYETNKTDAVFSPLKKPEILGNLIYYLRAITGFSLHFTENENELLVGAPGIYNYLGTVFKLERINNENRKNWIYSVIEPRGNFYEYSGYAICSGNFYGKNNLHYVTGIPRGFLKTKIITENRLKHAPYGSVRIFTFTKSYGEFNQKYPNLKAKIYSTQVGEYFGSSLTSADFNGDGFDDLVVGAPFRFNGKNGFNHGSVYIFYGNKEKLQYDPKNRLDGEESGAQFGLALLAIGDLDLDGFPELAISAPYEEESSGAIYIYSFIKDLEKMEISQKILGKNISPQFRGFGLSLSKSVDIDDNEFPDLAIGSPFSGHAVILRSKPTIQIFTAIRAPLNISTSTKTFNFKCCYSFTSVYPNNSVQIIRNISIDADFQRFNFPIENNNGTNHHYYEVKELQIIKDREFCEDIFVIKETSTHNYEDPFRIFLTYEFPQNSSAEIKNLLIIQNTTVDNNYSVNDTFCNLCPLLRKNAKNSVSKLILWDHDCINDGIKGPCEAELELNAEFLNLNKKNVFILGSGDLELEIALFNRGDPAYMPIINIELPEEVKLKSSGSADCENFDSIIKCSGKDALYDTILYKLKLIVVDNKNSLMDKDLLEFFLNASTIVKNRNDKNQYNLTLKLERKFDFLFNGYSTESSYSMFPSGMNPVLIQNIFKIESFGPSRAYPATLTINIPMKVFFNGKIEKFLKILQINATNAHCTENNDDQLLSDNKKLLNRTERDTENGIRKFNLNCSKNDVLCSVLTCKTEFLKGARNFAEISIQMEVELIVRDFIVGSEWKNHLDQCIIKIEAELKTDAQTGNQSHHKVEISNVIIIYQEFTISLLILISSGVFGLILLVVLTLVLGKAGFFQRKELELLKQLKEEALAEEKLIEEMIQKELEKPKDFENNFAFRYVEENNEHELNYSNDLDQNPEIFEPFLRK